MIVCTVPYIKIVLTHFFKNQLKIYFLWYTKVINVAQNEVNSEDYEDDEQKVDENKYKEALINNLRVKANNYLNENCVLKVGYTLKMYLKNVYDNEL